MFLKAVRVTENVNLIKILQYTALTLPVRSKERVNFFQNIFLFVFLFFLLVCLYVCGNRRFYFEINFLMNIVIVQQHPYLVS